MEAVLQTVIVGLPVLLLHLAVTLAILIIGVFLYEKVTPYKELALIRSGNVAASITMSGAIIGIAAPLAAAMAASVNLYDILVWGVLTVILQIVVYLISDFVLKDIGARIEADERAPALVVAAAKLSFGLILAAAVSG